MRVQKRYDTPQIISFTFEHALHTHSTLLLSVTLNDELVSK